MATAPNKDLSSIVAEQGKQIDGLVKSLDTVVTRLKSTPAHGMPTPTSVFGTPNVRSGENIMGSRGFSFMKMLGMITGAVPREQAKIELDVHNRLHDVFCKNLGDAGYSYGGSGHPGVNKFMAPLASGFFQEGLVNRDFRNEMKSLVAAGGDGADLDHMKWIRTKQFESMGYSSKALSWLNELTGGVLVAPPEMGELIELLRNKEALVNAGARVVPLPPQGRLKYPRQTSASLTYWVGENTAITESSVGTGEVTLQAKKLAVLIKAPNELIRFASPAAEALLRDDMTKSLALGLDLAGLEGLGGDTRPLGIINQPGINRITSSSPGANGDALVGQDVYRMIASIEESNAEMEGWIMRPKTLYRYFQLRSDAVAQGDSAGMFLFNLVREAGDSMSAPSLGGFPVTKSTQVSQVQSKGTSSNLTYITFGMWSDLLIGMFGAIEFAATSLGDTSFVADQTWIRALVSADIAPRHPSAFGVMSNLIVVPS